MSDKKKKEALLELVKRALSEDNSELQSVVLFKAVAALTEYITTPIMPKANLEYLALKRASAAPDGKAKTSIEYLDLAVLSDNTPQRMWQYSASLTRRDEELKELKKAEQLDGTAKSKLANSTQVFKVSVSDEGLAKAAGVDAL